MAQDFVGKLREISHARKHIERDQLERGQHILAYRALGSYTHHGIYVGKGHDNVEFVIHFPSNAGLTEISFHEHPPCPRCGYSKKTDIGIVKTCLDCFMKTGNPFAGTIIYLYDYSKTATYPPEEVVKRAYNKLQKKNTKEGFEKYNLIFNNCEDFATYCSTGSKTSVQVESVAKSAVKMAVLIAATSVAVQGYRKLRDE